MSKKRNERLPLLCLTNKCRKRVILILLHEANTVGIHYNGFLGSCHILLKETRLDITKTQFSIDHYEFMTKLRMIKSRIHCSCYVEKFPMLTDFSVCSEIRLYSTSCLLTISLSQQRCKQVKYHYAMEFVL